PPPPPPPLLAPLPSPPHPYRLSLHDALPISSSLASASRLRPGRESASSTARRALCPLGSRACHTSARRWSRSSNRARSATNASRSEEHTSELQSLRHLVCRLLLEKKKKNRKT